MGVDHGCTHVSIPQEFLNCANIIRKRLSDERMTKTACPHGQAAVSESLFRVHII
jgi:hypothetical protein